MKEFYTVKEAKDILALRHEETVRRYIRNGIGKTFEEIQSATSKSESFHFALSLKNPNSKPYLITGASLLLLVQRRLGNEFLKDTEKAIRYIEMYSNTEPGQSIESDEAETKNQAITLKGNSLNSEIDVLLSICESLEEQAKDITEINISENADFKKYLQELINKETTIEQLINKENEYIDVLDRKIDFLIALTIKLKENRTKLKISRHMLIKELRNNKDVINEFLNS